ncbi:MAG: PTS system mannose/fructose/sorbose family transporter subunit IID [Gemmatimonadales bacterium]|nr:PTS system mannose/fructose/sorbose family transporter subunit IID [Gemmatimonadales bacterium]
MSIDNGKFSGDARAKGKALSGRLRWTIFLRSLSLQASWNGQRMQNLGLLTVMLPWVRSQPRELNSDRVFCRRYYEFFNTNPYLANYLIGGLIRLEEERVDRGTDAPDPTGSFRDSLGRAFASLGDQLFWLGIRPALVMGTCLLALEGQAGAILAVVGIFAALQLGLRWRSLGRGYELGMDIVDLLGNPRWHRAILFARVSGAVATGLVAGWYLYHPTDMGLAGERTLPWIGLCVGWTMPALLRKRLPGEGLLVLAAFLVLVMAFAI